MATDWISCVPKDPAENVQWRMDMRKAACKDKRLQRCLKAAAREDILFFFNAFAWLYEPRLTNKVIPFCTFPHQDKAILTADWAIRESQRLGEPIDVVWDKSRVQGATYAYLYNDIHWWLFEKLFAAGLVTRNEALVDSATKPEAVLWKVDWGLKMLPFWMLPEKSTRSLTEHTIVNWDNGSTFTGFAATEDVGSGGRYTVFDFDELAKFDRNKAQAAMNSTQFLTFCRQLVSTHKGDSGVFYDAVYGDSSALKIVLDWKDNPSQNKLLYTIRDGKAKAVRPEEQEAVANYAWRHAAKLEKLQRRGFIKEGKERSPWYDAECLRPDTTPRTIAEELDRDPRGTVGKCFSPTTLDQAREKSVRAPAWQGKPVLIDGKLRLIEQEGGPLKLWFKPDPGQEPPDGTFAVGADIATGIGGEKVSNSCLVGGNCETGEQVLEYADPTILPTRFAQLAVAICRWLNDALLIWEATGPTGKGFGDEVLKQLGYWNVWRAERDDVPSHERKKQAGWANVSVRDKAELFERFSIGIDDELFTPRSEEMLRECGGWEWEDGKIVYHGTGHGDRAIAGGLAWKAMRGLMHIGVDKKAQASQTARYGSVGRRMMEHQAKMRRQEEEAGEIGGLRELLTAGAGGVPWR